MTVVSPTIATGARGVLWAIGGRDAARIHVPEVPITAVALGFAVLDAALWGGGVFAGPGATAGAAVVPDASAGRAERLLVLGGILITGLGAFV